MNDAEQYLDRVDDMLQRLGLPPVFDDDADDDLEAYEADLSLLELLFCFPNLSADERELIDGAARFGRRIRFLESALVDTDIKRAGPLLQKTENALYFAQAGYIEATLEVEASGLRAKLTEFQEQLLARVLSRGGGDRS